MTSDFESFHIAFRVSDKLFVVRDVRDNDVFAGTYREVESWLDQQENTEPSLRAVESLGGPKPNATDAILKATMLTQEMVDKALAADDQHDPQPVPEPQSETPSLRTRLFRRT